MKRIFYFTLLLGVLIVCGCSKDSENNIGNYNIVREPVSQELAITVKGVPFKMVWVDQGTFTMGPPTSREEIIILMKYPSTL